MLNDILMPNLIEKTNENENENILRPKEFNYFIGQESIIRDLKISIEASKKRNDIFDHVLFHGPPGLGKTTLAQIVALEMKSNLKIVAAPSIEKGADLASLVTTMKEGDVLFIDEIHRMRPQMEEMLYTVMDDFAIYAVMGKNAGARTMKLDIPRFTLVGATTKIASLSKPFRDRFIHEYKLEYYDVENLSTIIENSARKLDTKITKKASEQIAKRSRGVPRIANRLLRKMRDRWQVSNNEKPMSEEDVIFWMDDLNIDKDGLTKVDKMYLEILSNGSTHSLATISAIIGEDTQTIEQFVEPYLLKLGLIEKTNQGRKLIIN